ncbi:uncharacterized protein LOC126552374 [Aphis gossypii]|uniref:uncharacterized protein LOC126552374 n=1 Tax=Aphis gossypii TaxID=80765 RepID=UPI002159063D|nr:uncharacterized protein LOC126552374 [Aphis gossypii]
MNVGKYDWKVLADLPVTNAVAVRLGSRADDDPSAAEAEDDAEDENMDRHDHCAAAIATVTVHVLVFDVVLRLRRGRIVIHPRTQPNGDRIAAVLNLSVFEYHLHRRFSSRTTYELATYHLWYSYHRLRTAAVLATDRSADGIATNTSCAGSSCDTISNSASDKPLPAINGSITVFVSRSRCSRSRSDQSGSEDKLNTLIK